MRPVWLAVWMTSVPLWWASTSILYAQANFREDFEGPLATWRPYTSDVRHQVEQHARVAEQPRRGSLCERITITADVGTHVYLLHDIGQASVIDELRPSVWVRADRPGIHLFARVVLPRSRDPRTGEPLTTLVAGTGYTQVGRWQQLEVRDVPLLLSRGVRALRSEFGPDVDPREAFADAVVLNVYGGRGMTTVWIDELEIGGYLMSRRGAAAAAEQGGEGADARPPAPPPEDVRGETADQALRARERRVELQGSVLLAGGRPLFPRAIEHRGERLDWLQSLGFNAVRLDRPPSADVLDEARRLGMWVIAPPPEGAIGPELDAVLAWDLGRDLGARELEATAEAVQRTRQADRHARPIVCQPASDLRAYSRLADVLVADRGLSGTSLEPADYAAWLRQRPRFARPATPFWSTVDTQVSLQATAQIAALAGQAIDPPAFERQQIRLVVQTAIVSGSRGLLFKSSTPLDASDAQTRRRALALKLINWELSLIDPWTSEGEPIGGNLAGDGQLIAAVIQARRGSLVVPIRTPPGGQYAPAVPAGTPSSLVIPGAAETNDVFELTPVGLRPLPHRRITGGLGMTLEDDVLGGLVVLTHDPLLVSSLTRQTAAMRVEAAQLEIDHARRMLDHVRRVTDRLSGYVAANAAAAPMAAAEASLRQSEQFAAAGDWASAYQQARRGGGHLAQWQRTVWEQAAPLVGTPAASPAACCFLTLPEHWQLARRLERIAVGPNLLDGGDCEDLSRMISAGWMHFRRSQPGVRSAVELSPESPAAGGMCLRLLVEPDDPQQPPDAVESPPVWVTSGEVPVPAGALVRIRGMVRIPRPITGSVDGLEIHDSLGGPQLALRMREATAWRPFTLFRVAPQDGYVRVTLVLAGQGEVWLDELGIEVLHDRR